MGVKLGLYTQLCSEYRLRANSSQLQKIDAVSSTVFAVSASFAGIAVAYPLNLARVKLQVQGGGKMHRFLLNKLACF